MTTPKLGETVRRVSEADLTQAEFDALLDRAAIEGAKLFVLGLLTFGIYPCIRGYLQDKKDSAA